MRTNGSICAETDPTAARPNIIKARHRPARLRLIDKDGVRHGTYKDSKEAAKQAEEMKLGDPNMSDDEPDGWYLESTKHKAPKRLRRAEAR